MTAAEKLAFALVVPAAVLAAWITARATAPAAGGADEEALARIEARLDRIEKSAETARAPQGREERAFLLGRLDAIEARLAEPAVPSSDAAGAESAKPIPAAGTEVRAADADTKLRQDVSAGLTTEPGSEEHRAAIRRVAEHLVKSGGPPPADAEVAWAARLLDLEARRERVTTLEADDVATILYGLTAGHAARPGLAKAVAGGWGRDARLGGFLARLPANSEPDVHRGVLVVLDDENPSPAFGEYVMRLVREERDPEVLASALDLDRVEASATAGVAARFAQTVEARLLDGVADADMRSRAGLAIAVACLRSPDTGVEMLRRLAGGETDAKVAERYRQAAAALREGNATLKSLERLFK